MSSTMMHGCSIICVVAILAVVLYLYDPSMYAGYGSFNGEGFKDAEDAKAGAKNLKAMGNPPSKASAGVGAVNGKAVSHAAGAKGDHTEKFAMPNSHESFEELKHQPKKEGFAPPRTAMKSIFVDYDSDRDHKDKKNEGFADLSAYEGPASFGAAEGPAGCYPRDQLTPSELLPKDMNSIWAEQNPMGPGSLKGKNFLSAGSLIGVNTVGQSLRNANLQLRSEPANPQVAVSIFNQSTISPDISHLPLEIGCH
jgi:hypothetical protein